MVDCLLLVDGCENEWRCLLSIWPIRTEEEKEKHTLQLLSWSNVTQAPVPF